MSLCQKDKKEKKKKHWKKYQKFQKNLKIEQFFQKTWFFVLS